ncbi:MAG: hypothetical protein R3C14_26255 [Caldilineaceae bacterium]
MLYLRELAYSLYLYLAEYPLVFLITIGITLYAGAAISRRTLTDLAVFNRVRREFRRVGVRPSPQQEQALRDDFAAITAENARRLLRERLQHQERLSHEQAQLDHIAYVSQAHVALVKDIGVTLQALEAEYQKGKQTLASAQAREALRLVVEQAVVQITTLATTSPPTLPTFDVQGADKVHHSKNNDHATA